MQHATVFLNYFKFDFFVICVYILLIKIKVRVMTIQLTKKELNSQLNDYLIKFCNSPSEDGMFSKVEVIMHNCADKAEIIAINILAHKNATFPCSRCSLHIVVQTEKTQVIEKIFQEIQEEASQRQVGIFFVLPIDIHYYSTSREREEALDKQTNVPKSKGRCILS